MSPRMSVRHASRYPALVAGLVALLSMLLPILLPTLAAAQGQHEQNDGGAASGAPSPPAQDAPASPPLEAYRGVRPGASNLPPQAALPAPKGPAQLVWVGFEVRVGVPTVFLELTRPVTWKVVESDGRLVVHLRSVTVPLTNNRRPLLVQEFGTAVREVVARPRGRDVEVTIRLTHEVAHREHLETAAGGYQLLVIELI